MLSHTHIPLQPVVVYARWAGDGARHSHSSTTTASRQHVYSSSIPPTQPLKPGMRVRILATAPSWYTAPEDDQESYVAHDAHIVGKVSGVLGWKGRKIVLQIENECAINPIKSIRLRLPFAPYVTVDIGLECLPAGCREAHESDLNTTSVVRTFLGDVLCGADTCCPPWWKLVGEKFLLEPMLEDVGDRSGADGGHSKMVVYLASWKEVADAEASSSQSRIALS